ncbi:MAG TPA: FHA domain-containing protein [Casimicrobiaceae bacterium]|nr:FHA domain-containing protein [Casimicrobiaceae bacterium]
MGKLVLHLPDGSTREVLLARERMTIGRRVDNDICLPLPTVSAEHAAVVTVLDDSFLEDMGSRNGTLVNGKPIKKHFLRDNDEIDIGRQRLVYVSGQDDVPAPASRPRERAAPDHAMRESPPAEAPPPRDASATVVRFGGERPEPAAAGEREEALPAQVDTGALLVPPPPEASSDATASRAAPALELVDGHRAGEIVVVDGDEFVLGRVGTQLATIRRTPDGYRLEHREGDVRPLLNGTALPEDGALLALGDEIAIAGTRLRYLPVPRPAA